MSTQAIRISERLYRTRFTWFSYLMMSFFGLTMALLGPIMPFVGDRLALAPEFRGTLVGLHFTLNAAGHLIIGLVGDRLAVRIGPARFAWWGMTLGTAGLSVVMLGPALWMTLPAALAFGLGFAAMTIVITASLADAYPVQQQQSRVLTETHTLGAVAVASGPLLVGGLVQAGVNWQLIALLLVMIWAGLTLWMQGMTFPAPPPRAPEDADADTRPLPYLYWVFGVLIFLTAAAEWMILYWSVDFLTVVVGFEPGIAAAMLSVFSVAVVVGRSLGPLITARIGEGRFLVICFMAVTMLFPVYLYSPIPAINVAALFTMGLFSGNLFTLCLAGAIYAGRSQTSRASARIGVFGGLAILTMPQLVGSLADFVGIQLAYNVVMVVTFIASGVAVYANHLRYREASGG